MWPLILAIFISAPGPAQPILVGDFSRPGPEAALPPGWQPFTFADHERATTYSPIVEGGKGVIKAESQAAASALVRKIRINPRSHPRLAWRWKVKEVVAAGALNSRARDDFAARLYVTFAYDPEQLNFWQRLKFNAIKLIYGEYPPSATLNYIWANKAAKGLITASPYTSRVKMIVVESGNDHAGRWRQAERDILADYRQAFGRRPPAISGVGIMTDTDNTGSEATAWYGDIIFRPPAAP
ncbi:MAG: DUF3047 domain-containing protein [Thermodesulfobacteriota bacterium]